MRNSTSKNRPLVMGAFALLCVVGCGPSYPDTASVSGTVLLDGRPYAGAMVVFQPVEGRPASGRTDAEGNFRLGTFGKRDGALTGEHVVVVVPIADEIPEEEDLLPPNSPVDTWPIASHYRDASTSPLRAVVKLEAKNEFEFDLESNTR